MRDHELKPCPFCGGEARDGKDGEYFLVRCTHCGAEQFSDIRRVAVSSWNRRADLPPTPAEAMRCPEVVAMVEALRSAIEAIDAAYDGPDDNGRYSTRERAALAALEQAVRHE